MQNASRWIMVARCDGENGGKIVSAERQVSANAFRDWGPIRGRVWSVAQINRTNLD
jgi:hypothetical protein